MKKLLIMVLALAVCLPVIVYGSEAASRYDVETLATDVVDGNIATEDAVYEDAIETEQAANSSGALNEAAEENASEESEEAEITARDAEEDIQTAVSDQQSVAKEVVAPESKNDEPAEKEFTRPLAGSYRGSYGDDDHKLNPWQMGG